MCIRKLLLEVFYVGTLLIFSLFFEPHMMDTKLLLHFFFYIDHNFNLLELLIYVDVVRNSGSI